MSKISSVKSGEIIIMLAVFCIIFAITLTACNEDNSVTKNYETQETEETEEFEVEETIIYDRIMYLTATDGEYTDSVEISWNGVVDAEKYYIYRSDAEDGNYKAIGSTAETSFSDTTAIAGVINYYRVRSWNANGYSDMSHWAAGTVAIDYSVYELDGWWGRDSDGGNGWHDPGSGLTGTAGNGDGEFNDARGIIIDSSGNIYVDDFVNNRIQKFSSDGTFLFKWGTVGGANGQLNGPYGMAIDKDDNIYVADHNNARIQKFKTDGSFITKWSCAEPYCVAIDNNGYCYVTSNTANYVRKYTVSGVFISSWSVGSPGGIAIDNFDYIYIAINGANRIQKYSTDGTLLESFGAGGSDPGQLNNPFAIAFGPNGYIFVAELNTQRIQKFTCSGDFITNWGSAGSGDSQFNDPRALAVDPDNNVYVVERFNRRVQKFKIE